MNAIVKCLNEEDFKIIEYFDSLSDGCATDYLDGGNVYGLLLDNKIIGCCSFGGADCDEFLESDVNWTKDSLILSNVFILDEFRGTGYGSCLVGGALLQNPETKNNSVYLTIINPELSKFYRKLGFENIDEYTMVKVCN